MITYLKGKKTYIVGICGILFAIFGYASTNISGQDACQVILASLGLMGIRNGLTTEIQAAVGNIKSSK